MNYKVTVDPSTWQGPRRLPDETFLNYKVRRDEENRATKAYLKGVLCWKSVQFQQIKDKKTKKLSLRRIVCRGTYVKPKAVKK